MCRSFDTCIFVAYVFIAYVFIAYIVAGFDAFYNEIGGFPK